MCLIYYSFFDLSPYFYFTYIPKCHSYKIYLNLNVCSQKFILKLYYFFTHLEQNTHYKNIIVQEERKVELKGEGGLLSIKQWE